MKLYKVQKLITLALMASGAIVIGYYLFETTIILGMSWEERSPDWLQKGPGGYGRQTNWETEVMTGFFMLAIGALLTLRALQRLVTDLRGEPKKTRLLTHWIDERVESWFPSVASAWKKCRAREFVQSWARYPPLTAIAIMLFAVWIPLLLLGVWLFG